MSRFLLYIISGLLFAGNACQNKEQASEKPNILFISIDDLNDWVGYMKGYPLSMTPNIDSLASRSTVFTNAYCAAPSCNPSRTAVMTGIRPSTSGVYFNHQPWRWTEKLKNKETIPQYFRKHGYKVMGSGKIFHTAYPDPESWDEYWPALGQHMPDSPMPDGRPLNGIPNSRHFDWGVVDAENEEMGDWKVSEWVGKQLAMDHDKPFFLACGIYRPHLPWYVPRQYFDHFPLDQILLPHGAEADSFNLPDYAHRLIRTEEHARIVQHNQWVNAVQGYLASIAFADQCVGNVLEALRNSHYKDNTIIVLWSDHGWHLGEKETWKKFTLWEESANSLLLFAGPDVPRGKNIDVPVSLLDIFPTLNDMSGLPGKAGLEGQSIKYLIRDNKPSRKEPAITTYGPNNHLISHGQWRYIHYADGSEELYDIETDQRQKYNLAGREQYQDTVERLRQMLPEINVEMAKFDEDHYDTRYREKFLP